MENYQWFKGDVVTMSPVDIYSVILFSIVPSRDLQHHSLPFRPQ